MNKFGKILTRLQYSFILQHLRIAPNEAMLRMFEEFIGGYSLPKDYRQFLLEYGGTYFSHHVVINAHDPRIEVDEVVGVSLLFGFFHHEAPETPCVYDLHYNYSIYKDQIPDGVIPIASNGANRLCLSCGRNGSEAVYLWIAEEADPIELDESLYLVSPSFFSFLSELRLAE